MPSGVWSSTPTGSAPSPVASSIPASGRTASITAVARGPASSASTARRRSCSARSPSSSRSTAEARPLPETEQTLQQAAMERSSSGTAVADALLDATASALLTSPPSWAAAAALLSACWLGPVAISAAAPRAAAGVRPARSSPARAAQASTARRRSSRRVAPDRRPCRVRSPSTAPRTASSAATGPSTRKTPSASPAAGSSRSWLRAEGTEPKGPTPTRPRLVWARPRPSSREPPVRVRPTRHAADSPARPAPTTVHTAGITGAPTASAPRPRPPGGDPAAPRLGPPASRVHQLSQHPGGRSTRPRW